MSVTISTRKVVLSPHALRRALSSNYNPKSRKNLIQYSSTPQRKGEINPKRKREIRSMLQNYITAYFALIRKKNSGQQSVKCPSALYGRTAFTQTLTTIQKEKSKLLSFTLTFPKSVTIEEAKKKLEKWRRIINSKGRRRYCYVIERSKNGRYHVHGIGEMLESDFEAWSKVNNTSSPFITRYRAINCLTKIKSNLRRNWKGEMDKAINYIIKGTAINQGKISGRLYYISKPLRSFQSRKLKGKAAIKFLNKNIMYLTKVGFSEFYDIYEMSHFLKSKIVNQYSFLLQVQINSS